MTPSQFRSTAAWQRARALRLRGATHCQNCGVPFRRDLGPRHKWAPSVDHLLPLADIDLNTAEGRALAVNPAYLRPVCVGCNAKRGARYGNARRSMPMIYDLNEVAAAKEPSSRRW